MVVPDTKYITLSIVVKVEVSASFKYRKDFSFPTVMKSGDLAFTYPIITSRKGGWATAFLVDLNKAYVSLLVELMLFSSGPRDPQGMQAFDRAPVLTHIIQ